MQQDLKCSIHQNKNIIGFCFNKQCQNTRPSCLQCQKDLHSAHPLDIQKYDDVYQLLENNYKTREQVLYQISEIESLIKIIKLSIQSLIRNPDLSSIQSIHDEIENVLKTDQPDLQVINAACEDIIKLIGSYAENIHIFSFKMDNFKIKENIEKFNQVKLLVRQQGCNKSLKVLENIIIQPQQDQQLKIQSLIFILYQSLGLIDPSELHKIKKQQQNQTDIAVISLSYTLLWGKVGVNPLKLKQNILQDVQDQGFVQNKEFQIIIMKWKMNIVKQVTDTIWSWLFLIIVMKHMSFHTLILKLTNSQGIRTFNYQTNDVIQMIVDFDKAIITWFNQTNYQQYSMKFKIENDLSFFTQLHYQDYSFEILD